jgi:hypothetical protein
LLTSIFLAKCSHAARCLCRCFCGMLHKHLLLRHGTVGGNFNGTLEP